MVYKSLLLFAGVPVINCSAVGDFRLCGSFYLCGQCQEVCPGEHVDLLVILWYIPGLCVRDQLLWRLSQKTSLEPCCIGELSFV